MIAEYAPGTRLMRYRFVARNGGFKTRWRYALDTGVVRRPRGPKTLERLGTGYSVIIQRGGIAGPGTVQ